MGRVNNFDLIRLYAASSVLVIHACNFLGMEGWWTSVIHKLPGVPIFFFISGYLIWPSLQRSGSLWVYFKKRALRIYPALWVCLLVTVALEFLIGVLPWSTLQRGSFWVWVAAQSSIGQFYNLEALRSYGTGVHNGALWTISVELQFYILTPIFAWFVVGRSWVMPWIVLALVVPHIIYSVVFDGSFATMLLMVTAIPWLFMYLTGAWLSTRPDLVGRIVGLNWGILLAVFAVAQTITILFKFPDDNAIAFMSVAMLVLKCAYTRPEISGKLLRHNDISYGIYIYHFPIINLMIFTGLTGSPVHIAIVILCAVAAGTASWFFIERPVLALKNDIARTTKVKRAVPTS